MKHDWRIGQLARAHGLNPKTIRYYEAFGVLPPPARNSAGYRVYGKADGERLEFIGKAKAIGLTLREIREIVTLRGAGTQPCGHVVALLDEKLAAVDTQLKALVTFRHALLTLRGHATTIPEADGCICSIIEQGVVVHAPRLAPKNQPPRRFQTVRP